MNQGIGGRGRGLSRATIALGVVLVLVLALSAFGWWALSRSPGSPFSGFEHSAESLGVLIRSWGAWGVAGSIGLMVLHGFVTLPNKEREEPAAAIFSGGRDRCPPRVHGRRTEGAVRSSGCQVALDVEGIVDGRVSREKSLR